jgi:SAM-dependent methyltransferase
MLKKILRKVRTIFFSPESDRKNRIKKYKSSGSIPWSEGYTEYKEEQIKNAINDPAILESFLKKNIPAEFGIGIDERIVEYPWIFSQLPDKECLLLDAGSTFNFGYILEQEKLKRKKIHICTFYPESLNFNEKGISYTYADLRELPYKDKLFDEIVCQSTLEHIDKDNSIYGYSPDTDKKTQGKSYSYLNAINELLRILKPGGMLLLTFPFGKFENHVFFQQFDNEMLSKVENEISYKGEYTSSFIRYLKTGWVFSKREECLEIESYNPHTGKGKKDDGAAHCRCVCLIRFIKVS